MSNDVKEFNGKNKKDKNEQKRGKKKIKVNLQSVNIKQSWCRDIV